MAMDPLTVTIGAATLPRAVNVVNAGAAQAPLVLDAPLQLLHSQAQALEAMAMYVLRWGWWCAMMEGWQRHRAWLSACAGRVCMCFRLPAHKALSIFHDTS